MRKKYSKLPHAESKKRNETMFEKFKKLQKKGHTRMKLYQMLADEFDIEERNTVSRIIKDLEKEEIKTIA